MVKKTLYLDVETTGTTPGRHGIIQVACIVEIDGKVEAEKDFRMRPFAQDDIDMKALEINGVTPEQIKTLPEPLETFMAITDLFSKFIDKYDRNDKFYPAGYRVDFDMAFLKAFWDKNGDPYFGSYFNGKAVDPLPWLFMLDWSGKISLPNYRLATVCEHFGIELGEQAHDALADVRAVRELIRHLQGRISYE